MPQWQEGDNKVGNAGGSATAVLKGCENTAAAWEFAHWLGTDKQAFGTLIEKASLYPAANDLLNLPQLKADPYFGGQQIFEVFADAAPDRQPGVDLGPAMTSTVADLNDGLGKAWTGKGSIAQALSRRPDLHRGRNAQAGPRRRPVERGPPGEVQVPPDRRPAPAAHQSPRTVTAVRRRPP